MFDIVTGKIMFEAVAPDLNKFINALRQSCISSDDIHYEAGKIIGNVHKKDFNELKKVGEACNAQISVLDKIGVVFAVSRYKKRVGLIMGIILAFFMIAYLSDVVMIIEVYGNENVSDSYVLSLLNDAGIYIGARISEIDLRDAERKAVSSSKDISWIGIRSSGCKIQIEINEMDNSPEMVQKNIPCNIVAAKDAQIIEIKNVYSGMLVQMLNSGVKKGELLISGTVEDGKGGVYYTHSIGEIIGRYNETVTFSQPYLGEIVNFAPPLIRKTIHFFGCKIPLYIKKDSLGQYEFDEKVTYLELFDMKFPIGMITSEYRPYTIENVDYNQEQTKSILIDRIENYEFNFLGNENIKIVDKKIEFVELNGVLKAIVCYTLEGNIGISKEIMVK